MFDSVLTAARWSQVPQSQAWSPPTDVYETDYGIVVKVEIAGLSPEDFAISLAHRILTVSGTRRDPAPKLAYQQLEINYGHFQTEIYLPWPINADAEIEATYEQGFLIIRFPKAQARRVQVTENESPIQDEHR